MEEPFRVFITDETNLSPDYTTTLYFHTDGSLLLATEHNFKDRVQVTWIEKERVPAFLESLGMQLEEDSTEDDKQKVLKQIKRKIKTKQSFKRWLNEHNIDSRFGSWSERD